MKQGTKVFICLLCVVLATLITVACIFCIYYPHYKQNQHAAVIEDKPLERGEMRIMSCNLRCANVMRRSHRQEHRNGSADYYRLPGGDKVAV